MAIPEAILVEIIARLPLRSIARFKSVCKTWKSIIESSYFRRRFVSLHKNNSSSSSWSLMFKTDNIHSITEAIGFHGCETWGLPKSPGSHILPLQENRIFQVFKYHYIASSNGLVLISEYERIDHVLKFFVGNPVLQQWVEIPWIWESCTATSLVTRVDDDAVVSSFKVIMTIGVYETRDMGMYEWKMFVYSSETGLWSPKRLLSSSSVDSGRYYSPVSLNGVLYLREYKFDSVEPRVLIAHDFYGPESEDQCRVIPLPLPNDKQGRRCLTTSGGDVIYIEILYTKLKVWRLSRNNSGSSEWWELSGREIDMASLGFDVNCYPLAMNPFDTGLVYLWSQQHSCLVLGNLRTQEFSFHQESDNFVNGEGSCVVVNAYDMKRKIECDHDQTVVLMLSQFVLPQWMDPVPNPPSMERLTLNMLTFRTCPLIPFS